MPAKTDLVLSDRVQQSIVLLRGDRVKLDRDLATLYGVETRALVQAVKRNQRQFPPDFMFQLSNAQLEKWRSQIVMSNPAAKMGLRRRLYAFTEHGVAMLSSVLHSDRAAPSLRTSRLFASSFASEGSFLRTPILHESSKP